METNIRPLGKGILVVATIIVIMIVAAMVSCAPTFAEEAASDTQSNQTSSYHIEERDGKLFLINEKGAVATWIVSLYPGPDGSLILFRGGKQDTKYTGVARYRSTVGGNDVLYAVREGRLDPTATGFKKSVHNQEYYYASNGVVDETYYGIAQGNNGRYLVKRGRLDLTFTGVARFKESVGGDNRLYAVVNGKVNPNVSGFRKSLHNGETYYVHNGVVNEKYIGVAQGTNGKYFVRYGKIDFTFSGAARYRESVGGDDRLYAVRGGKVDMSISGFRTSVHNQKLYYAHNGIVDETFTGIAQGRGKKYYIKNGRLNLTAKYTGPAICINDNKLYYVYRGVTSGNVSRTVLDDKGNDYTVTNSLISGWAIMSDNVYYAEDGVLAISDTTIDGKKYRFNTGGTLISQFGIDVSEWNGDIDWQEVKDDGVEFAFIRVGGRGWGTGLIYNDKKAEENLKGAEEAGVPVGVYFFSQAIDEDEAREEARFAVDAIKGYNPELPIVIDSEWGGGDVPGRHETISVKKRTSVLKAFCDEVEKLGYKSMIYSSTYWLNSQLDMSKLKDYDVWVAQYADACLYQGEYKAWQYSSKGSIKGIQGNVDMNIWVSMSK